MFYLRTESNSRFLFIGRISCASILASKRLRPRDHATANQSESAAFRYECGNPACQLCARPVAAHKSVFRRDKRHRAVAVGTTLAELDRTVGLVLIRWALAFYIVESFVFNIQSYITQEYRSPS